MSVSAELSGVCTMAWIPLLIFLLHCTGSFSQLRLTQSPSDSASLGASVKLTCTLSSLHRTYTIGWYQQQPEEPPKCLMWLSSTGNHDKGDGVPDRFSGSSSGAHRYLTISNIQPEDEAIYFCGTGGYIGGQYEWVFGGGTKLTVLGQPTSQPSVTLFPPSPEELKTRKATLVCMINDFYPGAVSVTWKADGTTITQGVETSNPSKQGNKYLATSFLTLTEDVWKSKNSVSCEVTHEGVKVEKSLSPAMCS